MPIECYQANRPGQKMAYIIAPLTHDERKTETNTRTNNNELSDEDIHDAIDEIIQSTSDPNMLFPFLISISKGDDVRFCKIIIYTLKKIRIRRTCWYRFYTWFWITEDYSDVSRKLLIKYLNEAFARLSTKHSKKILDTVN